MPTCIFHFHKQFIVDVSDSLSAQSSLSFITVYHMFEQVLFYCQRQKCGQKFEFVSKKKVVCRRLKITLISITISHVQ